MIQNNNDNEQAKTSFEKLLLREGEKSKGSTFDPLTTDRFFSELQSIKTLLTGLQKDITEIKEDFVEEEKLVFGFMCKTFNFRRTRTWITIIFILALGIVLLNVACHLPSSINRYIDNPRNRVIDKAVGKVADKLANETASSLEQKH